jgi:hypothetical protein
MGLDLDFRVCGLKKKFGGKKMRLKKKFGGKKFG